MNPSRQPVATDGRQFEDIRITDIDIYKLNVPLSEPFIISLGTITDAQNLVVKLHTNQGITGVGECCPYVYIVGETQESCFAHAQQLARLVKGKNPLYIEDRLAEMHRAMSHNSTVKSAFDMALYDLKGKFCRMPLYALLGGSKSRKIYTDMTVSITTPEKMAADALRFKEMGFPAVKVKLGGTFEDDVARIRAIRAAVGDDIPLRIDANQGWDYTTAINTLKAIAPYNVEHCEEPLPRWNIADQVRLREKSPIPIMADESLFDAHDALRLAALGACDYFNIKLSKSAGIHGAMHIAAIGAAAGIKSQVGCMSETRFATTALVHVAAANRSINHYDLDSPLMLAKDPVIGGIRYGDDWQVLLPDSPGIGADFDPAFLDEMPHVRI